VLLVLVVLAELRAEESIGVSIAWAVVSNALGEVGPWFSCTSCPAHQPASPNHLVPPPHPPLQIGSYPWWPAQLQRPTQDEHFRPKHAASDLFCVFYGDLSAAWGCCSAGSRGRFECCCCGSRWMSA
jgi:hypothetical protein